MAFIVPTEDEAVLEFQRSLSENLEKTFGADHGLYSNAGFVALAALLEEQIRDHYRCLSNLSIEVFEQTTEEQKERIVRLSVTAWN